MKNNRLFNSDKGINRPKKPRGDFEDCDCEQCQVGLRCASVAILREQGDLPEVSFAQDVGWDSDEQFLRKLGSL